jgi:hypothetical protein
MSSPGHDDLLLDFQDSQVSSIQASGADLRVVLSAAHVLCRPGHFAQAPEETEGYLTAVLLLFRQARLQGELTLAMGRLAESELWMRGQRLRRLPLPCESTTAVRARLAFANGVVLEIEAEALACPLSGDERFTASLAC